jgi:mxaJ protein
MSSAYRLAMALVFFGATLRAAKIPSLRVCSDPNNMPFSNRKGDGFENKIARLIAKDMGMPVSYFWLPQREKFFRQTLKSGACDVVMGVPAGFNQAATTRPFYRSSYVFVSRQEDNLQITSFDDPRLRTLRIGVHILGDGGDSLPPVHALTTRGIVRNLVGYSIFGNLAEANPSADLIAAVTKKAVDIAVVWGPLGGYFAQHGKVPLHITPVEKDAANPDLPLSFDICLGVREGDAKLKDRLNTELIRRRAEIEHILTSYGLPRQGTFGATMDVAGR